MQPAGSAPYSQQLATRLNRNPFHTPTPYSFKIHCNIIPSSTLGFRIWSLHLRFADWNAVHAFHLVTHTICPVYIFLLGLITLIISCKHYKLWSSRLRNCSHPSVTYSTLGPHTFLGTLFSDILNQCSFPSERHISHSYKTGTITTLYILSFYF
jgi:hypothetical protein